MREARFWIAARNGCRVEWISSSPTLTCRVYRITNGPRILCLSTLKGYTSVTEDHSNAVIRDLAIMQYTGLKDKNGVEIYEGDVVTHPAFPDRPIQVVHRDGKNVSEFVVIDELGFPMQTMALTVCEIIGNIWENPELING